MPGRRPPLTGAERAADSRARRRKCRASFRCDAGPEEFAMLIRRGYLDEAKASDARAVKEAITRFLAEHAALDQP